MVKRRYRQYYGEDEENYEYSPEYSASYDSSSPAIIDFGQLQMYNPKDFEFMANIAAQRQQRYDIAQSEISKYLEQASLADFSELPEDLQNSIRKGIDEGITNIYQNVVTNYGGDFGRALPEISRNLAVDKALLARGMEESKRYGKALSEYQSLAAQGKAPRKIILDKNGRPTYKTIPFNEYHQLPKFDTEKKTLIPGKYNPLIGAGNHEEFVKNHFTEVINRITNSIGPTIVEIGGEKYLKTGAISGLTEEKLREMMFNEDGTLNEKGKAMIDDFRHSTFLREEVGDDVYEDDTKLGKYLFNLLHGQVFRSVVNDYSRVPEGGNGGNGGNDRIIPVQTESHEYTDKKTAKEINELKAIIEDYKMIKNNINFRNRVIDENSQISNAGKGALAYINRLAEKKVKKVDDLVEFIQKNWSNFYTKKEEEYRAKGLEEEDIKLAVARDYLNFIEKFTAQTNKLYVPDDQEVNNFIQETLVKPSSEFVRLNEDYSRNKGLFNYSTDILGEEDKKKFKSVRFDYLNGRIIILGGKNPYALPLFKEDEAYKHENPTPNQDAKLTDQQRLVFNNAHKISKAVIYPKKEEEIIPLGPDIIVTVDSEGIPVSQIVDNSVVVVETDPETEERTVTKIYYNSDGKEIAKEQYNSIDALLTQATKDIVLLANPFLKKMNN